MANSVQDDRCSSTDSNYQSPVQTDPEKAEKINGRNLLGISDYSSGQSEENNRSRRLKVKEESGSDHAGVQAAEGAQDTEEEAVDVQLGIGDFVHYSILVGKASSHGDWNVTAVCFVAVLVGLCLTLVLLPVSRRPLPALPLPIALGLAFYFLTREVITPFAVALSERQVFI